MDRLMAYGLPILVSAFGVFIASFITHMVLPYHRSDMLKVPGGKEDEILDALRRANLPPGDYGAPHADGPSGMKDPAFIAKATKGPLTFFTVAPGAAPSMGPYLLLWFVYCGIVSTVSGYIVWRVFGRGASFNEVFKLGSIITFLSYAMALPAASIWYRRSWMTTLKSMFDGAIYGLLTGAACAWLWPK